MIKPVYPEAERRVTDAKRLLVHYFRNVGGVHDSDSVVEIEEIVDHIFEAAVIQFRAEHAGVA